MTPALRGEALPQKQARLFRQPVERKTGQCHARERDEQVGEVPVKVIPIV